MYRTEIYDLKPVQELPKVAVPEEFRQAFGKDSFSVSEMIPLPYIINVEMRVNGNGDYKIIESSQNQAIRMPTKIHYRQGKHYFSENDSTKIGARELDIVKLNEKKEILGFSCEKYSAREKNGKEVYIIWATKKLPATITAFHQLPSFGHAVLEISSADGAWKRTATQIIPVDPKEDVFYYNIIE